MSVGERSRTVTTRYVWIPHGAGAGWLLVHRSIAGAVPGGGRSSEEFWVTGEIVPEDATDLLKDAAQSWQPMVLGEPVNFLLWPFVLTAVTGRQLRKVREQVLLTGIRPLADIRVQVTDTAQGPVVAEPALVTLADDPYSPRPGDLELGDAWESGGLDPARRREVLLAALERRVELPVATATQVAHVNRFVADSFVAGAAGPRAGLDELLQRRAVRAAVAALLADPADDQAREHLVDALRGHGWSFTAAPLELPGPPKPALLERLVLFLAPAARGADCRIVAPPAVADLLAGNDELPGELAGFLAPLDPGLRTRDTTFLELLPGAWDVPRERGISLAAPVWDEAVTTAVPGTVALGALPPEKVDIRHVELFDSQGLPSGKFDLSSIPAQSTGESSLRAR